MQVVTRLTITTELLTREHALVHTLIFPGGGTPGSGITQAQADARYLRITQRNAANGVAGLGSTTQLDEQQLPLPAVDLDVLFVNALT